MREKNSRKFWSRLSKLVAVTLALVLVVGVLPANAASKVIVVKTKKQLLKAMEKKSSATIIFRTNRKTRFIIPAIETSANKKLVMEAPNARAFNKATFKTITLNESEYFNERGNDNSLYIKGDGVKLTVSKGIEARKVSITATDVVIKVASNGNVGDIVCNKKEADITVAVAKNAEANITIKKKADLTVTGDKTADIKVVSQAADSKITATAPVDIVAEKNTDVVLEKGSEGSTVDSGKDVDVDISGAAEKQATVTEDGKTVQEPEKEEKKEEKKEENKDATPATDNSTPSSDPSPSQTDPVNPVTPDDSGKVTIRIAPVTGGKVSVTQGTTDLSSGGTVATGSSITIKLTADDNYDVLGVTINDGAGVLAHTDDDTWIVSDIVGDVTITASFITKAIIPIGPATSSAISLTLTEGAYTGTIASGSAITDITFELKDGNTTWVTVTIASGSAISTVSGSVAVKVEIAAGVDPETVEELTLVMSEFNYTGIKDEIKKKFTKLPTKVLPVA